MLLLLLILVTGMWHLFAKDSQMRKLLQPLLALDEIGAERGVMFVQDGLDLHELVGDLSLRLAVEIAVIDRVDARAVAHDARARPARVALVVPRMATAGSVARVVTID